MKIISFDAQTTDGIIEIPKSYLGQVSPKCHVIIVMEQEPEKVKKSSKKRGGLTAVSVPTKGFKFNRDEANER